MKFQNSWPGKSVELAEMYKTELNEMKKDHENELDDNKESFKDH